MAFQIGKISGVNSKLENLLKRIIMSFLVNKNKSAFAHTMPLN